MIPQRYGKAQQELNTAVLTFLYKTPLRLRLKTPMGLWGGISSVQNNLPAALRAGYFLVSLASGRGRFPDFNLLCRLAALPASQEILALPVPRAGQKRCPCSSGRPRAAAPPGNSRSPWAPPRRGAGRNLGKKGRN